MLETIIQALLNTLSKAGIRCVSQYPMDALEPENGAVVCVGVKSSRLLSSGAGEYLGIREAESGNRSEVFGFRLELNLGLDIFAPDEEGEGALGCVSMFSLISDALYELPSGLKNRELVCGAPKPDGLTEMYHCPCELRCAAYLVCEADDETGEFADFVLRGVLRK